MKTAEEILKESDIGKYLKSLNMDYMSQSVIKSMKLYANEKLDEAAEKAGLIYESDITGAIGHYTYSYGTEMGEVRVDQESILKLKDEV